MHTITILIFSLILLLALLFDYLQTNVLLLLQSIKWHGPGFSTATTTTMHTT
jgi:hypothetical protein